MILEGGVYSGAVGETRTLTPKALEPKPSASTNSRHDRSLLTPQNAVMGLECASAARPPSQI